MSNEWRWLSMAFFLLIAQQFVSSSMDRVILIVLAIVCWGMGCLASVKSEMGEGNE